MLKSSKICRNRFLRKLQNSSIVNTFTMLLLLILSGCSISESEIVGTYKLCENNFTFDTLIIYDNHTYKQLLYSKENDSLHYTNTGSWRRDKHNRFFFENFNKNEDHELSKDFNAWESSLIDTNVPVKVKNGKVYIILNSDNGIYYEKVE